MVRKSRFHGYSSAVFFIMGLKIFPPRIRNPIAPYKFSVIISKLNYNIACNQMIFCKFICISSVCVFLKDALTAWRVSLESTL